MTEHSLVLLRHAKADAAPGAADMDRPLSERGRADARAAGTWLATRHRPALVLCSPSRRTRQTWHEVAAGLGVEPAPQVRYDRRLYLGGVAELREMLGEIEESAATVLVIGHNPSLSQLAFALDPDGGLDSDGLRTCGLTVHAVPGGWPATVAGPARVTDRHTARAG